jgi:hypothetical protein
VKVLDFFKKHPILIHFIAMFLLVIGILVGLFFWLDDYTRHGQTNVVPDVRGMMQQEASATLESVSMQSAVIDSVFRPTAEPGIVLEQNPSAGSLVKEGRRIYLIVNAKMAQMIPFPDVVDMALRQAKVQIEGAEFLIKEVKYEPSEFKDLVLYVEYNGDSIQAAQKIPFRSEVIVHVGQGDLILQPDSVATDSIAVEEVDDSLFGEESFF